MVSGVDFDRFPPELRALPQWVVWRVEERGDKPTKVPYAVDGRPASTTDPGTWAALDMAISRFQLGGVDGIGFVFSTADPFVGVDLDGALDGDRLAPWAAEIVAELDSYTEISPSGRGLHVLIRGELRAGGNRRGPIELYSHGRYFTMSGRVFEGRDTIHERQGPLDAVHARHVARSLPVVPMRRPAPVGVDDHELVERAMRARNGGLFSRLWRGQTGGYSSRSEADLALVSLLVFWTGGDTERVDRLFRASGLYRAKWERENYRRATIDRALASARDLFSKPSPDYLMAKTEELGPGTVIPLDKA